MNKEMIVRAWKDPAFRASLSPEDRASLPDSPSGTPVSELEDTELQKIIGGLAITAGEDLIRPNTGCVGPVRLTCGIINCTLTRETVAI